LLDITVCKPLKNKINHPSI